MDGEWHLDVYKDKSVFHDGENVEVFEEGSQSPAAKKRYSHIISVLDEEYLEKAYCKATSPERTINVDQEMKKRVNKLVSGVTSETGRALVELTFLQLVVKSILPDQSVRLHKSNSNKSTFSWKEGISMRTLDSNYITPFLREKNLLKMNKFGLFMTRSLAENYPYTPAYKAKVKGPMASWMDIVNALETEEVNAYETLLYL